MKKYLLISILLGVALLHGCVLPPPSPGPSPNTPFIVEIWTNKTVYHIGESIVFSVRADRDCYLTLYDISTEGEVTQIFPNLYASDNFIRGGQMYTIPTTSDKFDFEVLGPPGIERVRAVATIENVNFLKEFPSSGANEIFPRITQKPSEFDDTLDRKLHVIPTQRWTEASFTIQIVQ